MNAPSSSEATAADNRAIVCQLVEEVLGRGAFGRLPALVANDFVGHFASGDHYGPDGVRIEIATYRTAFPDLTVTLEEIFGVDDKVVRRFLLRGTQNGPFLGAPPSGRAIVLRGMAIDRLAGGQLVESWVHIDPLAGPRTPHPEITPRREHE